MGIFAQTALSKSVDARLFEEEVKMWIEHLRDVSKKAEGRDKEGSGNEIESKDKSKGKLKRDQRLSPPLDSLDGKFGRS